MKKIKSFLICILAGLVRILYWSRPSRQAEYNARKEEWHINMIDERKQYIRAKSGQIAYQIMTFVLLGLSFILAVFRAEPWIIAMIFGLFIFQYIIGIVVFKCLEKQI